MSYAFCRLLLRLSHLTLASLMLTSCSESQSEILGAFRPFSKRTKWLECSNFKPSMDDSTNHDKFILKISGKDGHEVSEYIDSLNRTRAVIKQNPVSIQVAANIRIDRNSSRYVSVFYNILRDSLKFSKTTSLYRKSSYMKHEDVGGITIQNAGVCSFIRKPKDTL